MKNLMAIKTVWYVLFVFMSSSNTLWAADNVQPISDLDELLETVKKNRQQEAQLNKQREQAFIKQKNRQQALLAEAKKKFEASQVGNNPLKKQTAENAERIKQAQQALLKKKQELGDIYSIYTSMAGDFSAALQDSMVTTQKPARTEQMNALLQTDRLASMQELEQLWLLVQEEMTESGKIARYEGPVVTRDGHVENRDILRLGTFTAFSEGDFLRYVPETGELLALSRQPSSQHVREAAEFSSSAGQLLPVVIDPTGGSLMGLMTYTPTLQERVEQGGVIGYIIIGLGLLGLLITLWRALYLAFIHGAMRRQMARIDQPSNKNPLGRILLSASAFKAGDDKIQYKLDEAVLAEVSRLERSHNLIKLLAAISPLLGLLGTVTGMIVTFQAISLFGSGDPKLMAGGISQALVTTVLGLIVAIPLLFGHNLVSSLAGNMVQRLDEQSAGLMARLMESQSSKVD
ncbi:MotA/TolQ/ExbB proton channel family protein [Alkalimarinus coralli]|uniref:MotA/TolQ/ExbB proton channel family protein n=1 Tax=Alkalimarinus coralli TaxID=2935863 RepID=UPI00202B5E93|nr:MotA/TolQ/ExbB proton channel family protein [Alkalimarinus coralli]